MLNFCGDLEYYGVYTEKMSISKLYMSTLNFLPNNKGFQIQ